MNNSKVNIYNLNNQELEPDYNEIIEIKDINIPKNYQVNMHELLCARLRIKGYGVIKINEMNELISGGEGIVLAMERGKKKVGVKRIGQILMKHKK